MRIRENTRQTPVKLSAAIARLRVPAHVLATLAVGDRIEVESDTAPEAAVRLMAGEVTIALAAVRESGGQLIAQIISVGDESGTAERKPDKWQLTKNTKITA